MNILKFFFIVITLGLSIVATADTPQANQNLTKEQINHLKVTQELIIAKAELAALNHFQEQVLSTVYWSLGTIAGLAILLTGYGWWTNFRIYDREKASLNRELKVYIDQELNKITEQFRVDFGKLKSDTNASLDSNLKTIEARITTFLEKSIEDHKSEVKSQISQVNREQNKILKKILTIELSNTLKEREKDLQNKSYRNALQESVFALEIAIKLSSEYEIGEALDLVTLDINNVITFKDTPIDNYLIGQLVNALDKVEGKHAHAAAGLKSKTPDLNTLHE